MNFFKYEIINKNIDFINYSYDTTNFIPMGHRCTSAIACNYASLRTCSLPFDWVQFLFPGKIKSVLSNNFEDYVPDVKNGVIINKYDIKLAHFNSNIEEGIQEYKRRIERIKDILKNNNNKVFIFTNEDFIYNNDFRTVEFKNKLISEIIDLDLYLKENQIKHNILFFDFNDYSDCIKEGIENINFVKFKTKKTFNKKNTKYSYRFRKMCGHVLKELFGKKNKEVNDQEINTDKEIKIIKNNNNKNNNNKNNNKIYELKYNIYNG